MRKLKAFLMMMALTTAAWAQGPEYFPLKTGRKLHYQTTNSQSISMGGRQVGGSSGVSNGVEEVAGPSRAMGKDAILVRAVKKDSSGGPMGSMTLSYKTEAYYQVTPGGIFLLGSIRLPDDTSQQAESTRYEQPLMVLKTPPDSGATWKVGTLKMQGVSVSTEAKVMGREDVTVPAGAYKNCLKIKQTSTDVGGSMQGMGGMSVTVTGGEMTVTAWYAPGVGLIKEQVNTRLALSSPAMPPDASAEVSFEQTRLLAKIEGAGSGKEAKKESKKK